MGREKKRLSGWFFKYEALGKRQLSSQTTIPTSKEKKPGLNGPDRRWCLVVTWGWQRALSAVIPCTASEEKGSYVCPTEIGCKLLIRSASSMAFFFLPFSLLAEVRRDQHAAKGGQLWLHPAVPQGGRTTKEPLAKGWQARLALPHLGHAHLNHQQDWIIWGRKSH